MDQRFLVFALVIVPVLSVCLGFTVHFAIRPMIQTLVDAIHGLDRVVGQSRSDDQSLLLRAEVDALRAEVEELRATHDFDRRLLSATESRSTSS